MGVPIPEADVKKAYERAIRYAQGRSSSIGESGDPEFGEVLIDAATDGIMWAIENCTNADTWGAFAYKSVRRFVGRRLAKLREKRERRPELEHISDAKPVYARDEKPTQPATIEELPEDLAFVVRLYMVDGYTLREIALLCEMDSPNTAAQMLRRAAEILAAGRIAPERSKGQKRLSAG